MSSKYRFSVRRADKYSAVGPQVQCSHPNPGAKLASSPVCRVHPAGAAPVHAREDECDPPGVSQSPPALRRPKLPRQEICQSLSASAHLCWDRGQIKATVAPHACVAAPSFGGQSLAYLGWRLHLLDVRSRCGSWTTIMLATLSHHDPPPPPTHHLPSPLYYGHTLRCRTLRSLAQGCAGRAMSAFVSDEG